MTGCQSIPGQWVCLTSVDTLVHTNMKGLQLTCMSIDSGNQKYYKLLYWPPWGNLGHIQWRCSCYFRHWGNFEFSVLSKDNSTWEHEEPKICWLCNELMTQSMSNSDPLWKYLRVYFEIISAESTIIQELFLTFVVNRQRRLSFRFTSQSIL